jgi:hypothetical protein
MQNLNWGNHAIYLGLIISSLIRGRSIVTERTFVSRSHDIGCRPHRAADTGRCISVLFEHAVLDGFPRRVSSKLPGLIVRYAQQSVHLRIGHHGIGLIARFGGITRASGPGVRMVIDSALPMRLGLHAVLLFS